ncbi:caspase-8-like [Xyrichtys novacula]|uniref:Caspase-8-like n=1 Tax=Xyrichtys novacula TaxID=13765 RepID=A0AAV1GEY8_XYRNO|nr:caspase-8-like [Xyrichtys novacula]
MAERWRPSPSVPSLIFSLSFVSAVRSTVDERAAPRVIWREIIFTIHHVSQRHIDGINKENVEGHVVELVDKIVNKGEETCQDFLELLQTDEDIKKTFPKLKNMGLNVPSLLPMPVQACSSGDSGNLSPESKGQQVQDEQYKLNSKPVGVCVIINNETFEDGHVRLGTEKDAASLGEVFSWLGFRVLMCKDRTESQMYQALEHFASDLSDPTQLQQLDVQEWSGKSFATLQGAVRHGDAFICCILSHGSRGKVFGTDGKPLPIKKITKAFRGTDQSPLTGKPKVFLIQACQGSKTQKGVLSKYLQADDDQLLYIPEAADFLVAKSTVEGYVSFRNTDTGSWFIQSVCKQLQEGCPRGEHLIDVLLRVNRKVSQQEGSQSQPGTVKQMSEFTATTTKKLVLSPQCK